MTKRNIAILIVAGLFATLLFTDLHGQSVKDTDVVVATVNGVSITKSQLTALIQEFKSQTGRVQVDSKEKLDLVKSAVRRQLILEQKEIADLRKQEKVRKQVKEFEDRLVLAAFVEQHIGQYLTVTDAELQEYYKTNLASFSSPPKAKAKHILLRSEKEAKTVLEKLRKGADFSAMAKQYSIDLPNALEGGSMGTIEKGKILPELEQALFRLDKGEFSDIVKTRFGYHILTVEEIIPVSIVPFDQAKTEIRKTLIRQKEAQSYDKMAAEIEKGADIKIFKERVEELDR